jgi:PAS domain S-box-containing protein
MPQSGSPVILVVDDEESVRSVLCRAFERAGFPVIAAPGPHQALEAAGKRTPDVVLTDMMMPDMDGAELCARLRGDPRLSGAVLLLMTGAAGESNRAAEVVRGLEAGADDYLFKPIELTEVVARVRAWLRVKQSRDSLAEAAGRAEHALRGEQAFSQAVVASLADGLFVLSSRDDVTSCNRRALEMLGIGQDELLGRPFAELLVGEPGTAEPVTAGLRAALEPGREAVREVEVLLRRQAGPPLPASLNCSMMPREGASAADLVVLARDITLRRQLEASQRRYTEQLEGEVAHRTAEIRASEEKYRALTENVSEAIVSTDLEDRITSCNRAAGRLLRADPGQLQGTPLAEAAGGALQPLLVAERRGLVLKSGGWSGEIAAALPGRDRVTLHVSASLLRSERGEPQGLWYAISNLSERDRLQEEMRRKELYVESLRRSRERGSGFVGSSVAARDLRVFVENTTRSTAAVLIEGESGTGKEVLAEEIHRAGPRSRKPFVIVDCSALSEALLESELFGHVRGAFTGAVEDRPGLIEAAKGGTLFIDEIGEASLNTQAKLLRVIEKGEYRRLGSVEVHRADVRVVAATNRRLRDEVRRGRFREDLYFRLKVLNVVIPPLRDRREDVPELVTHFLAHSRVTMSRPKRIRKGALAMLETYAWPGNVRELSNVIERAVILAGGAGHVGEEHLPPEIRGEGLPARTAAGTLAEIEKSAVEAALKASGGNRSEAARRLGIHRSSLLARMKKYRLQ